MFRVPVGDLSARSGVPFTGVGRWQALPTRLIWRLGYASCGLFCVPVLVFAIVGCGRWSSGVSGCGLFLSVRGGWVEGGKHIDQFR